MITQADCIRFLTTAPNLEDSPDFARAALELLTKDSGVEKIAITVGGNHLLASAGLGAEEASRLEDSNAEDWADPSRSRQQHHLDGSFYLLTQTRELEDPLMWRSALQVTQLGAEYWRFRRGRHIRDSWVPVTRELTTALLDDIEEEDALQLATELALSGARADASLLFLPGLGDTWSCEFAAPASASKLIGMPLPVSRTGAEVSALSTEYGQLAGSDVHFAGYGPALLVPLVVGNTPQGALLMLRESGSLPFSEENAPLAENFAATMSLSLQLAQGRQAQSVAVMLEERDRIGRDLHDLGIQLLFATGMQLDRLRAEVESGEHSNRRIAEEIRSAMVNLEDAVSQIRQVVRGLKETEQRQTFVEMLESEASRARQVLGFAPSLILELDGVQLDSSDPSWEERAAEISSRVSEPVAADAIATIRESLANVVKHAGARSAKIEVTVSGKPPVGELIVSVIDDGKGINLSRTRSSGIANMGSRASYRGGSFAVGLGPRGTGTAVVWRVPLESE